MALGITPTAPETGFGYIERGDALGGGHVVRRFVEKPDRERAQAFLADGNFTWNGGIFVFRAGTYLEELTAHRADIAELVGEAVASGREEGELFHPAAAPFCRIEGESIDYVVMEKTGKAVTVIADMGWSDIGNWHALRDARGGDDAGNRASENAELVDCRNVLADSDGPRIWAIGLEDVAILVDGDDVLVTSMEGAQKVGKLTGAAQQ